MTQLRPLAAALAAIAPLLALLVQPAAAEERRPVLVELFTSQGCNSCPPADAALGRLAARPGVVALSLHVDYWDYLGWRDTFGDPAHTTRQKAYRDALGERMVYTPQAVVQGAKGVVGSHEAHIEDLIAMARQKPAEASIALAEEAGGLVARISGGAGAGADDAPARLWVASYARRREVEIGRGENGGRTLAYHNVVLSLAPVAEWAGGAPAELRLPVPPPGAGEGVAVWLQRGEAGPVLCAAKLEG